MRGLFESWLLAGCSTCTRCYRPNTSHFLTTDPYAGSASTPASLHRYLYGADDPVDNTDPSGLCLNWDEHGNCRDHDKEPALFSLNFSPTAILDPHHSGGLLLRPLTPQERSDAGRLADYNLKQGAQKFMCEAFGWDPPTGYDCWYILPNLLTVGEVGTALHENSAARILARGGSGGTGSGGNFGGDFDEIKAMVAESRSAQSTVGSTSNMRSPYIPKNKPDLEKFYTLATTIDSLMTHSGRDNRLLPNNKIIPGDTEFKKLLSSTGFTIPRNWWDAESKLAAWLTERQPGRRIALGVSRETCSNCVQFLQQLSNFTEKPIVVMGPQTGWIFRPGRDPYQLDRYGPYNLPH